LDCRIYARAAALALGMDRWLTKQWAQLQKGAKVKSKIKDDTIIYSDVKNLETRSEPIIPSNVIQKQRIVRSAWMSS
jgi:phage terminase large subunit GpA-like protein